MRRLLLSSLLLLTTSSAFAWVEVRPNETTMNRGESMSLLAVYVASGFLWPPLDWNIRYSFASDQPDVLAVSGTITPSQGGSFLLVTALKPGTAGINLVAPSGAIASVSIARVIVHCDEVGQASAILPIVTTQPNQPVTLRVTTAGLEHPLIDWFAGNRGDRQHPLNAFGPSFIFTPGNAGTQYVWARVQGECSYATVEFRVDALSTSRRRASRR